MHALFCLDCIFFQLAALRRTTRIVSAHQRSSTISLNSTAGGTSDPAGGAVGGRDQPRAPTWVQVDTPPQPRERVSRRQSSLFSSDGARKKWRDMERKVETGNKTACWVHCTTELYTRHAHTHTHTSQIMDSIMKRQTMTTLAKDMDHWIEKRDQLSQKIEDLRRQREALIRGKVVVGGSVCVLLTSKKTLLCILRGYNYVGYKT